MDTDIEWHSDGVRDPGEDAREDRECGARACLVRWACEQYRPAASAALDVSRDTRAVRGDVLAVLERTHDPARVPHVLLEHTLAEASAAIARLVKS